MSDVFISYARPTAAEAHAVAEALRALGYKVWRDDALPVHREFAKVIEEQIRAAKAVVVVWSAAAAQSDWVQSEADLARRENKLVQLNLDGATLPMPFDRIQCADLAGWAGDLEAPAWRKIAASVAELVGAEPATKLGAAAFGPELSLPAKPSIAVMPFANLSGDAEQDYFVDGMVEEVVTALTRFKSIFVIASSSSLTFKGKAVSAKEAARRLGVRYVVEGSVRKAAGRVRIAVRLIDAAEGAQIWAERFEDTLEDVFALQDRVALSVAGVIEPVIQLAASHSALHRPTRDTDSYDLFLRAWALTRGPERTTTLQALELLEAAIGLDEDFGQAMAVAAYCHGTLAAEGDHRRRGIELTHRAMRVAGDDATVLSLVAGAMRLLGEDFDTAVGLADRALAHNPGSSLAWRIRGLFHAAAGEVDAAIEHAEASMRLEPFSPLRYVQLAIIGQARFQQGRYDEAALLLKEAQQMSPDYAFGAAMLAACYGHLGQPSAAAPLLAALDARYEADAKLWGPALGDYLFRVPEQRQRFLDGLELAEPKATASRS